MPIYLLPVLSNDSSVFLQNPKMNPSSATTQETKKPWDRLRLSTEAKVIGFVLSTILVTEVVMRGLESRLSRDIVHLQQFQNIASRLESPGMENTRRILVVGNSLVREGILPEPFRKAVNEQLGCQIAVERFHPDNTALAEWYYAIDRFVISTNRRPPDAVMIVFQGSHLRDAPSRHINELGRFYCGPNQLFDLATFDLLTLEQWLQFGLNSSSSALTNHARVERRVLDGIIPEYRLGIQELNRRSQTRTSQTKIPGSYKRLSKLIQSLQTRNIAVILVEIPIQNPSPFDPELVQLAIANKVLLVKASQLSTLTPNAFVDGIHMNSNAAEQYSRELAAAIDWRSLFQELPLLTPTIN